MPDEIKERLFEEWNKKTHILPMEVVDAIISHTSQLTAERDEYRKALEELYAGSVRIDAIWPKLLNKYLKP